MRWQLYPRLHRDLRRTRARGLHVNQVPPCVSTRKYLANSKALGLDCLGTRQLDYADGKFFEFRQFRRSEATCPGDNLVLALLSHTKRGTRIPCVSKLAASSSRLFSSNRFRRLVADSAKGGDGDTTIFMVTAVQIGPGTALVRLKTKW
jgi:hypothetical protein